MVPITLLSLPVSPGVPVVTDEGGNVIRGVAGPYLEGGRAVMTCKTIQGELG